MISLSKIMNTCPAVDEANELVDFLKSRIETIETKNTCLKNIIAFYCEKQNTLENNSIIHQKK